ncbi:hypothetical protein [Niallia nealsonii]|nr:hypothetical protein [Niallia nealsonii]
MTLFTVMNREHSYGGRIGIFICEDTTGITLSFGEEKVTFSKDEVREIL